MSLSLLVFAQTSNNYYYANREAHYWHDDSTSIILIVKGDTSYYDVVAENVRHYFADDRADVFSSNEDDNIVVNSPSLPNLNINHFIYTITSGHSDNIPFISFAKIIEDGDSRIWLRNEVMVKFREGYDTSDIRTILSNYNFISIEKESSTEYNFLCRTEDDVVSLSNAIYESNLAEYSTPDFYGNYQLSTNDPLFTYQYYLRNDGQVIPNMILSNEHGLAGMDIKAEPAWNFLELVNNNTGNEIRVAVLDDGVGRHEDLKKENGQNRVVTGYTPNRGDCGSPTKLSKHGQTCAGIIAASHNNIGIAGVAPNSLIVPIRIFKINHDEETMYDIPMLPFSYKAMAKAVKHAWDNLDADILNFSNGEYSTFSEMNDKYRISIERAFSKGRSDKGCVIVAATGNDYSNELVHIPASHPNVIAVGALDKQGCRGNYSNYSNDMSVVAFGGKTGSLYNFCDIRTTDRMGNKGYVDGNYFDYFGMTSAAAPMVSGVASLMLSVNPNLTSNQVKNIIENTAQKLNGYQFEPVSSSHPNGTWNEEVGYGLVDAHKAVVYAYMWGYDDISLSADVVTCNAITCTCNIYHSELFTYEWSCSSNLNIIEQNGTQITLIPLSSGDGTISVNVLSYGRIMYTKNLTIDLSTLLSSSLQPVSITPTTITNNTQWSDNNILLSTTLMVDSLATLTITGTVHCTPSARLIIMPPKFRTAS